MSNTAVCRSVTFTGLKSDRNFRGSSESETEEIENCIGLEFHNKSKGNHLVMVTLKV